MHLRYRNLNHAFAHLVRAIHTGDVPTDGISSRNGETLTVREPTMVTYENPRDRVLLNRYRDANPFFHLYESLWMLAGRNDIAPLCYYNSRYKEFSDDGVTANGAYGYRWRHAQTDRETKIPYDARQGAFGVDQLEILISHLRSNPHSRRAVLQMWNVEDDLLKIGGLGNRCRCDMCDGTGGVPLLHDEGETMQKCPKCDGSSWMDEPASKDVCCNLSIMFSIESGDCLFCEGGGGRRR